MSFRLHGGHDHAVLDRHLVAFHHLPQAVSVGENAAGPHGLGVIPLLDGKHQRRIVEIPDAGPDQRRRGYRRTGGFLLVHHGDAALAGAHAVGAVADVFLGHAAQPAFGTGLLLLPGSHDSLLGGVGGDKWHGRAGIGAGGVDGSAAVRNRRIFDYLGDTQQPPARRPPDPHVQAVGFVLMARYHGELRTIRGVYRLYVVARAQRGFRSLAGSQGLEDVFPSLTDPLSIDPTEIGVRYALQRGAFAFLDGLNQALVERQRAGSGIGGTALGVGAWRQRHRGHGQRQSVHGRP